MTTRTRTRALSALVAATVGLTLAGTPAQTFADPATDGLIAHYPLESATGTTIVDASGNGNDGTIVGGGIPAGTAGFQFTGTNFVDLPDNLITGLTAVTVTAEVLVSNNSGDYFFYNLGNTAVGQPQSGNGYLFSSDSRGAYKAKISDAAWGREQTAERSGALPISTW